MSVNLPVYILDSFGLLAYLGGEGGMERVQAVLQEADVGTYRVFISILNLGEVAYIVERERGLPKAQAVLGMIQQLPIAILPATSEAVFEAAHIKALYPVTYADAFAIAAAQTHNGVILTGHPEFEAVEDIVQIEWLVRYSQDKTIQ